MEQGQLCWHCVTECEWMESEIPIEGWIARPSRVHKEGWRVVSCPKYMPSDKAVRSLFPQPLIRGDKKYLCPTCHRQSSKHQTICGCCGQKVYFDKGDGIK